MLIVYLEIVNYTWNFGVNYTNWFFKLFIYSKILLYINTQKIIVINNITYNINSTIIYYINDKH